MERLWWQLPGPAGFVERLVQALRDGQNVILQLPEHAPDGLPQAVRATAHGGVWSTVRAVDWTRQPPAQVLAQRFASDLPVTTLCNARTLCQSEVFAQRLLWLEEIPAADWPAWKAFLTEYQHASHTVSLLRRTLFCVVLVGQQALDPPPTDICLSHHCWRGVVEPLDMLLYASHFLRPLRQMHLLKEIAIHTLARIAGSDPHIAERFAHEPLERLLEPLPTLQQIARERGWPHTSATDWLAWENGSLDNLAGHPLTHAAALAVTEGVPELTQRLWSAQVSVLFPWLETQRRQFIRQLWDCLSVPFETSYETITDKRDLELAHLEVQLLRRPTGPHTEALQHLRQLKRVRNRLAHAEPLERAMLLNKDFAAWIETLACG